MGINKVNYGSTTLIDISEDTVTAGSMLSGTTAHDNSGAAITGSIASKSSSDLTASGATVTAPAGYYASSASKAVASGTAGTPTATKGAVSNHSISVTPSVTNTTGYITGGTKTGTAVTVSASELVSGALPITSNGAVDVTNYASVNVNVTAAPTIGAKTVTNADSTATSLAFSGITEQPQAFFLRCTSQLARGSSKYYYVVNVRYNGTNTYGNYFYVYSGTLTNTTSKYSFTYSNSTLTVSSSGSRSATGGSFYAGDYELTYIY